MSTLDRVSAEESAMVGRGSVSPTLVSGAGREAYEKLLTGGADRLPSEELRRWLRIGWSTDGLAPVPDSQSADPLLGQRYARRRELLSEAFPGEMLLIPSGGTKVRSNDTYFEFRPNSDYVYLTGDLTAGAVLVMLPVASTHEVLVYRSAPVRRGTDYDDRTFYRLLRQEIWEGAPEDLAECSVRLGVECRDRRELRRLVDQQVLTRVERQFDHEVDEIVDQADPRVDLELARVCAELRSLKDDWEINQLREAVAITIGGFEDLGQLLAQGEPVSERLLEVAFDSHARLLGSGVGYRSIVAGGKHSTAPHWTGSHCSVGVESFVLVDAGAETHTLYTADVTRVLPVGGVFKAPLSEVYDLVLDAQEKGIQLLGPGRPFIEAETAALEVLEVGLRQIGVTSPTTGSINRVSDWYRRYAPHGTSHFLGLDVHDCSNARSTRYRAGVLERGMVLTMEPGLYFQPDDETVPASLRGIGVRIEDDLLITDSGSENLSGALPRQRDQVESWMARLADRSNPSSACQDRPKVLQPSRSE